MSDRPPPAAHGDSIGGADKLRAENDCADKLPVEAGSGRPPRPPVSQAQHHPPLSSTPRNIQDRTTSLGEQSEVSALSYDDSPRNSRRATLPTHNRGVSWDFNVSEGNTPNSSSAGERAPSVGSGAVRVTPEPAPASLFQPNLAVPPNAQSPGIFKPRMGQSFRKPKGNGVGHVRKPTNITLSDVAATPFEDEAETAIIRALEEREWERAKDDNAKFQKAMTHHRNATADNQEILTNVPDEALDMLEEDVSAKIEQKPSVDSKDTDRGSERNRRVPLQPAGRKTEKPTLKTMAVQIRNMQKGVVSFADGGGYLKNARASAASTRTFGGSNSEGRPGSPSVRSQATASTAKRGFLPLEKVVGAVGAPAVSPADALANDAAVLLAQETDDAFDVEAQVPTPTVADGSPGKNWTKLRAGVRAGVLLRSITKQEDMNVEEDVRSSNEEEEVEKDETNQPSGQDPRSKLRHQGRRQLRKGRGILEDVLTPKIPFMKMYLKTVMFVIILPMLGIASILYYVAGNPLAGCNHSGITEDEKLTCATYSWWVIFLGIRQVITFSLAKATEVFFVDVLALRTTILLRTLGPYITLLSVQARGWPFTITYWAVWDFALLYDPRPFSKHWLFYQRAIGMCNDENQAGVITNSEIYQRTLIAVMVFGLSVGLKRGLLAFYLGKNSCTHYGPQLEKLMRMMLLISEVARLSDEIKEEHYVDFRPGGGPVDLKALRRSRGDGDDDDYDEDNEEEFLSERSKATPPASPKDGAPDNNNNNWMRLQKNSEDMKRASARTGMSAVTAGDSSTMFASSAPSRPRLDHQPRAFLKLGSTAKIKVMELLGEWEEPEIKAGSITKDISIQDVLHFRQAVMCLEDKYPFSAAFGPAKTRVACIESAQAVFEDLLLRTPEAGDVLPFETISLVALEATGELDEDKARKLIRMFRPDRHGNLTALDFVKSCDKVYKNLRTLRAAIANSSQIDRAFEQIVDVMFYFVLWMIVLSILNLDPWTLFLSLSGFILSFAFMFGAAASKYFEGILLILVRRPYDIGDRVAISNPQNDTSANGSSTWFVEGVTLYTTTVRFATTNEVATYSNGSLSSMRIINGMRSPKATVYIYLKFASDVPYEKVMIFKSVIETFVKDRPRQWLSMCGFRATRVEADLGFIEYVIVLQHVESWQNIGPILNSKAELSSYCLEVQKKLDMKYTAPPLPVNLAIIKNNLQEASPFEYDEVGEDVVEKESVPDLGGLGSLFAVPEPKKTK